MVFFKHFLEYAKPSEDSPVLVVFDNHDSHINIDLINMARENNVTLLTLPPHCSHKLQPLDVAVYGPFKNYFNAAAESLMLRQPGKPIQIYDLPELSKEAIEKAFTPSNIISGFKCTGIYPFNENTFTEDDFLCAYVTDRGIEPAQNTSLPSTSATANCSGTAPCNEVTPVTPPDGLFITPDKILPFPKAGPRIKKTGGRKPGKSRVITQTPEKEEIEQQQLAKKRKKDVKKIKTVTRKVFEEEHSSSEDENINEKDICKDSSSDPDFNNEEREEEESEEEQTSEVNTGDRKFSEGNYILIKLKVEGKRENNFVHYIGKVLQINENISVRVKYLRKSVKTNEFYFPDEEDLDEITPDQVVGKLMPPTAKGSSKRLCKYLSFKENLKGFDNIR